MDIEQRDRRYTRKKLSPMSNSVLLSLSYLSHVADSDLNKRRLLLMILNSDDFRSVTLLYTTKTGVHFLKGLNQAQFRIFWRKAKHPRTTSGGAELRYTATIIKVSQHGTERIPEKPIEQ